MDIIAAYREVGTYRGAAQIAGTTPKTVKRVIDRQEAGGGPVVRAPRVRNYDDVAELVVARVGKTKGRISAKRLLLAARAAGYTGSPRNFRRLVAAQKQLWRQDNHRGRRPAVWSPGEYLVIDWGSFGGLHVFCAVLAWCRVRFVRFTLDERAETTLAMLAECFEVLGGVPGVVLADRMGWVKGGVVANRVVPTPGVLAAGRTLRVSTGLLRGERPAEQGNRGEPRRLRQAGLDRAAGTLRRSRRGQRVGRGVVCRGQRGSAQRNPRGAGRAVGDRT
jgi:hypothetical protein